ncbi:cytochrome c biogenesis CcdA family protein [Haloglycomyces albus]|uniref:cytochrome c biogenesis CcdA family protein n=1 Tax=Haloglycomyces albus TaxID=526067 RepID=UPI0004BAA664|nr:cytochrome c biogenesis CcdA family protein [Haloglycomyces albus]
MAVTELLFSTTLLASFLGGVLALAAPCCVSVMLPAYFASTFRHRRAILGMTLVFAAGVATVILPIALGATALSRLFISQHVWVYSIGGVLMLAFGVVMMAGGDFKIPMPGMRSTSGKGMGSTYLLGAFSGISSACCAPVLAGVVTVSGATASFPAATAVGVAYVFGMVAPLAVLALLWDKRDWGSANLLSSKSVTWRIGGRRKTVPMWSVLSGGVMAAMGALTFILAFTDQGMDPAGWQARVAAALRHFSARLQEALASVPGIITSLLIFVALGWVIYKAVRGLRGGTIATGSSQNNAESCCEDHESEPTAKG